MTTPATHIAEAHKLTADAIRDLYELQLRDGHGTVRFTQDNSVSWQSNLYEGVSLRMSGDTRSAEGEDNRPVLQVMNRAGIFNQAVRNGYLEMSVLIRVVEGMREAKSADVLARMDPVKARQVTTELARRSELLEAARAGVLSRAERSSGS